MRIYIIILALLHPACIVEKIPTPFINLPKPIILKHYKNIEDYDGDGIDDRIEHQIAQNFRPYFIFDSAEKNREENEPIVLYQVHPLNCRIACKNALEQVEIIYAYLFKRDGGYNGGSSTCDGLDYHIGDNQTIRMEFSAKDGKILLVAVYNGKYTWPEYDGMYFMKNAHPTIYLSAGKHHAFNDTAHNHKGSPYSAFGCSEDVNGKGDHILADISNPSAPRGYNNVGERILHSRFVNDLKIFGLNGEYAWDEKNFCGGLAKECAGTPMTNIWK